MSKEVSRSEEELQEEKSHIESEPKENLNAKRVEFTQAVTKEIYSPHTGSLLAQEEPIAPQKSELLEKANKIFHSFIPDSSENQTINYETLLKIIIELSNFSLDSNIDIHQEIDQILTQLSKEKQWKFSDDINNYLFSDIISKYFINAYLFGQRLRRAAGRGETEIVKSFLLRGCSVNTADGEGLTSLHYASEFNKIHVINILKNFSSNLLIDPKCKYGWTPLFSACHHGNIEVVNLLLEYGANKLSINNMGKSPLHEAAARNYTEICSILLENTDEDFLTAKDNHGLTPLHDAALKGSFDAFELLSNYNPELKDKLLAMRDVMDKTPMDYFLINQKRK